MDERRLLRRRRPNNRSRVNCEQHAVDRAAGGGGRSCGTPAACRGFWRRIRGGGRDGARGHGAGDHQRARQEREHCAENRGLAHQYGHASRVHASGRSAARRLGDRDRASLPDCALTEREYGRDPAVRGALPAAGWAGDRHDAGADVAFGGTVATRAVAAGSAGSRAAEPGADHELRADAGGRRRARDGAAASARISRGGLCPVSPGGTARTEAAAAGCGF